MPRVGLFGIGLNRHERSLRPDQGAQTVTAASEDLMNAEHRIVRRQPDTNWCRKVCLAEETFPSGVRSTFSSKDLIASQLSLGE